MSVKDDLLSDLPQVYPGLGRSEVERLMTLLDQGANTDGAMSLSMATALQPLVPDIARRIESYGQGDVDDYLRMLRGAAVLLLQEWPRHGHPPTPDAFSDKVEAVQAEG